MNGQDCSYHEYSSVTHIESKIISQINIHSYSVTIKLSFSLPITLSYLNQLLILLWLENFLLPKEVDGVKGK